MVYISGGKVQESPPWSLERLVGMFWGIIAFIIFFFKSLVGLDSSGKGGGSRNGKGGGPGNGPGGGPKRIGRITTIDDCSMPGGG